MIDYGIGVVESDTVDQGGTGRIYIHGSIGDVSTALTTQGPWHSTITDRHFSVGAESATGCKTLFYRIRLAHEELQVALNAILSLASLK